MKFFKRLFLAWQVLTGKKYASAYPKRMRKGDRGFMVAE
jgi:hypothetical protein